MGVVTVASTNLTCFANRTDQFGFAKKNDLKPMGICSFGVRGNHSGIMLSMLSKLQPENSTSRTNFLNHISCSSSTGNQHGDNGFDVSNWIDKFNDAFEEAKLKITYLLMFPSFMLAMIYSIYVFHQERGELLPPKDIWWFHQGLLAIGVALTVFSAVIVGVVWRAGLPLILVLVGGYFIANIMLWYFPSGFNYFQNFSDRLIHLWDGYRLLDTLVILVKKLDDGWSVAVEKVPVHIEDDSKIPQILDEIESIIKNDNAIFSEKETPLCVLSQVNESIAELTVACYMKDTKHIMTRDEVLSIFRSRLYIYVSIIKRHGGAIVEEASEVKS